MSPIDDDMKEAVEWVNNHMSELSFTDQMKVAKAGIEYMGLLNEIYKKYNKPERNTFLFKL